MKFFNIKTISVGLLTTGLLFSACTDLTDGYSTDPVNVTDPNVISTDKFLSGMLMNLIGAYEADMNRLTGMWTGQFSGEDRQYIGLANYGVSGRDFNTEWGGIYSSVIKNATIVKQRAKTDKNPRMMGIAQTTEAMAAGLAADLWGDVPFSEMAQYPVIVTPKYDAQADVYAKVHVLLDSAITNFAVPDADIASKTLGEAANGDFFFGADADAWTAVCHTLKARFYLHTREYPKAVAQAALGIAVDGADMMAPHGSSYLQNFNLYYSFTNYDRPGYMAANSYAPALLDPLNPDSRNNASTNENSRFNYLYLQGFDGSYDLNYYVDFDYGVPTDYNGFFGASTSFPMVTYRENQLILAEASLKGAGNFDDALDALNDLRAYYDAGGYWNTGYQSEPLAMYDPDDLPGDADVDPGFYLPYTQADFEAGGIENAGGLSKEDALLTEILEERYVSLLGQLEVFNDVRRTGNYLGLPVKAGNSVIPQRLLYPQSEINTNPNVPTSGVGLFDPTPVNKTPY